MGWVNSNRHAAIVLDTSNSDRDRTWALRSCCYSVASTARGTVSTNELVNAIAQRAGCLTETRGDDKLVIISNLDEALRLLTRLRLAVLSRLREYDSGRRYSKAHGKRFPVLPSFDESAVIQMLAEL